MLPHEHAKKSRIALLEIVLMGSLTASAAVFWEFGEFLFDRFFGTNIQVGLANTIQDLAMGLLGALTLMIIRARQLRLGIHEIREISQDWLG